MNVEQRLKTSIYTETRKICREVGVYFDMEFESNSLDLISELTWKKLQDCGLDLEAFQKHAKRSTITIDDVKLLVRKNESLKHLVEVKSKTLAQNKEQAKDGKRKRKASTSAD